MTNILFPITSITFQAELKQSFTIKIKIYKSINLKVKKKQGFLKKISKTRSYIGNSLFWPNCDALVSQFLRTCELLVPWRTAAISLLETMWITRETNAGRQICYTKNCLYDFSRSAVRSRGCSVTQYRHDADITEKHSNIFLQFWLHSQFLITCQK